MSTQSWNSLTRRDILLLGYATIEYIMLRRVTIGSTAGNGVFYTACADSKVTQQ
jgi:hypothetical protein